MHKRIMNTLPWSTLSNIGQLPAMKMLSFVPFIGTIIIFNEKIINNMMLSQDIFSIIGIEIDALQLREISLYSIYFVYFGLLFLGIGSILFSIFCPLEIKQHRDINNYVENINRSDSLVDIKSKIIHIYDLYSQKKLTEENENRCIELTNDIIHETLSYVSDSSIHKELIYGSGYYNTDKLITYVIGGQKAFWGISKPFLKKAVDYAGDVLRLEFNIMNNSSPVIRCLITFIYTLGFILLFTPTLLNIFTIIKGFLLNLMT